MASGAHAAWYGRSIDDQRRRRLRRAIGESTFGTEDGKVAMLRTGSRGDEQGVVALVVESVADVLAGWPLLLGGRRRREGRPARGADRRSEAPPDPGRSAVATVLEVERGPAEVLYQPAPGTTPPTQCRVRRRGTTPRRRRRAASGRQLARAVPIADRHHRGCDARTGGGRCLCRRRGTPPTRRACPRGTPRVTTHCGNRRPG